MGTFCIEYRRCSRNHRKSSAYFREQEPEKRNSRLIFLTMNIAFCQILYMGRCNRWTVWLVSLSSQVTKSGLYTVLVLYTCYPVTLPDTPLSILTGYRYTIQYHYSIRHSIFSWDTPFNVITPYHSVPLLDIIFSIITGYAIQCRFSMRFY